MMMTTTWDATNLCWGWGCGRSSITGGHYIATSRWSTRTPVNFIGRHARRHSTTFIIWHWAMSSLNWWTMYVKGMDMEMISLFGIERYFLIKYIRIYMYENSWDKKINSGLMFSVYSYVSVLFNSEESFFVLFCLNSMQLVLVCFSL